MNYKSLLAKIENAPANNIDTVIFHMKLIQKLEPLQLQRI